MESTPKLSVYINEYIFHMLSEKYQGEQKELDEKIRQFHEAMETATQTAADAENWVDLMKQYVNPTELTAELLNTLIEKTLVHEEVNGENGSWEQERGKGSLKMQNLYS